MIKRACWEARHSPEGRDIPKFAFGHLFSFKFPTKVHHKSWTCYGFRKLSFPSHLFRSLASSNLCLERCSFILFSLFLTISYRFLPWSQRCSKQRSQFHPTNHYEVLICDAETWSHKKRMKRICSECVDCFGHRAVFMCWTESGLCTRDGWQRADHPQRCQFHPTNLFLSLNLWCKDLVPLIKKEKDM